MPSRPVKSAEPGVCPLVKITDAPAAYRSTRPARFIDVIRDLLSADAPAKRLRRTFSYDALKDALPDPPHSDGFQLAKMLGAEKY